KLKTSRLKLSLVELVRLRVQKNVKKGILSNINFLPFSVVIVAAKCSSYRSRISETTASLR
ncbi:hypothetical protein BpHYR1_000585, partial [Brachionus plicatilis]